MRILSGRRSFFISILLLVCNVTYAQTGPTAPTASVATPAAAPAAKPAPVRSAAVTSSTATPVAPRPKAPAAKPAETPAPAYTGPVWKKQITRDIDMGEKVDSNVHHLRDANPDNTLLEMLAIGIKGGRISSFYTSDFSLATRIKAGDFNKLFIGRPDTIAVRDAAGKYHAKVVRKDFNFSQVHKYRIMEEWTSYPGIGKTEIQVIGIAPLKDMYGDDNAVHGVEPIFWVHYTDDVKAILARYDQYHPNNTLGGHLWSDYFNAPASH